MFFRWGTIALMVLLNNPGSLGDAVRVTCSPSAVCALRESTVNLTCSYSNIKPQQSFWFSSKQKAKWRKKEDPEDLSLESDYAGRVRYTQTTNSRSTLTITDLRETDSGEYHLLIRTETGERHSSSNAVTLTVSDPQVKMTKKQMDWTLNCSTSCLTSKPQWYKNGRPMLWRHYEYSVSSRSPGSYSCSVSSSNNIHSNTVCVFGENCWNVTYADRRVCAVEGSSVEFPCMYSYPSNQTVTETFWFYFEPKVEPRDLSVEEQFAGRVEFLGDKQRKCALRMHSVRKSDSREYFFRFLTDSAGGRYSGKPGVILTVTDLKVVVSPITPSKGEAVTLTCISTCTLPSNQTYIWYKNGKPVTNIPTRYNQLYLESSEDVLQYSCALGEGPEKNTMMKLITVGVPVFLAVTLTALMLIRCYIVHLRRKMFTSGENHRNTKESSQFSVRLQLSEVAEDQDDVQHYASIHFKPSQTQPEAPPPSCSLPLYAPEDQDVQYATVNFSRRGAATQRANPLITSALT